jgi:hypothetical protein
VATQSPGLVTRTTQRSPRGLQVADDGVVTSVADYLGDGLARGERVLVIATDTRTKRLVDALVGMGFDVAKARSTGQLTLLDVDDLLDEVTRGGTIDRVRFARCVSAILEGLTQGGRRLRAYGELVEVLFGSGRDETALEVETIWNELAALHAVALLCPCGPARTAEEAPVSDEIAVSSRMNGELASLCHELQTPVAAIAEWVAVLKAQLADGDAGPALLAKGLDIIQAQARAQERILAELRQLTGAVSGVYPRGTFSEDA